MGNAMGECYVQDTLAKGHQLRVVASGNHNSIAVGLMAVFAKEFSQAGVVEALQARWCYGTTGARGFYWIFE